MVVNITHVSPDIDRRWIELFEDRYGEAPMRGCSANSASRASPFAEIAAQFGVTRATRRAAIQPT